VHVGDANWGVRGGPGVQQDWPVEPGGEAGVQGVRTKFSALAKGGALETETPPPVSGERRA